ncbi:hypothetical protein R6Q59_011056 [Mikania micrantha]
MADMAGVFRNTIALRDISDDMDEYDYDEDDGSHQGNNVGENDGFVDARLRMVVLRIMVIKMMMIRMMVTQWRWDSQDDQHIFDGFGNVLKDRYPDIMNEFRETSKGKAREDGHVIPHGEERFDITSNYPPDNVPLDRWQRLCKIWNTDKWLNRSKVGRNNRKNDLSRHTGGSMGFDEHRIRLVI